MREIAQRAGHRNVNAVQYHFGDRSGLLQAIFAWRVSQMEETRGRLLGELEERGTPHDLLGLIRALCEPILDLVDEDGQHSYAAFMSQYHLHHRPAGVIHAADSQPLLCTNLNTIIRRLLSLTTAGEAMDGSLRISLAYLIVINTIVVSDSEGLPTSDPVRFRERFEKALMMATTAINEPIP